MKRAKKKRLSLYLKHPLFFNLSQTKGLEHLIKKYSSKEKLPFKDVERAEKLIKESKANIAFAPIDRAFYLPVEDKILMPKKEQFKTQEGFYSTAFHELSHWTGHRSRLNRPTGNKKGSKAYAFEELITEISASFICCHLGFEYSTQHSAHVKSWLEVLKEGKKAIFRASSQAQKATEFILGKLKKEASTMEIIMENNKKGLESLLKNLIGMKSKSRVYLTIFFLVFSLICGFQSNAEDQGSEEDNISSFLAKCYIAYDSPTACAKSLEPLPSDANSETGRSEEMELLDILMRIPSQETKACDDAYLENMEKAFQTLAEEQQQLARLKFDELRSTDQNVVRERFIDIYLLQCPLKTTDLEKYICAIEILSSDEIKETSCKFIIEDLIN